MRHKHIHNSVEGQTFFTDSYPPDNLTFPLSHTCPKSKRSRRMRRQEHEDTHKHISPPTASQRRRTFLTTNCQITHTPSSSLPLSWTHSFPGLLYKEFPSFLCSLALGRHP